MTIGRAMVLLLALAGLALGDVVYVKGRKVRGRIVSEGDEVVVNEFNSTVDGVVLGTHRFAKDDVKKIVRTLPEPHHAFHARLAAAETAEACVELAAWCLEEKLKEERLVALEKALLLDPAHADARKLLGSKAPKGDRAAHLALARRFVAATDAGARDDVLAEIRKDRTFPFEEDYLLRAWRSQREKRGYQQDRPLAMRADQLMEGARYTLVVPDGYDPLRPTPLVIGLHGGGAGGADGKLVVGSGAQAMPFYQRQCEARGWICACPTAVQAGWGGPNDDLIDALLDELRALWNIDENRIYLVGHSMGGGGAWVQGSRVPEVWAAVAPASSYGVRGLNAFEKTRTGFYVYHSDDDPRTRVEGVRPRMLNYAGKDDVDFVYTELPGRGHEFPAEVVEDIFRFFDVRLLARGPGRFKPEVRPQSSFLRKVSREEKKYLPGFEPLDADEGDASLKGLLKDLRTGGGVAERAVPALVAHADASVPSRVAKILLRSTSGPDVRRYAAQVLGGRKARDEVDSIGRVLLVETEANAIDALLAALDEINDAAAGEHLVRFVRKRAEYLSGRIQGGDMHHEDWATITPSLAHACSLLGSYKTDHAAAAIAGTVVDDILLATTGIVYDVQNQNPLPAAQALGAATCVALGRLGGADARGALEKLVAAAGAGTGVEIQRLRGPVARMSRWASDPAVAAAAREALAGLGVH